MHPRDPLGTRRTGLTGRGWAVLVIGVLGLGIGVFTGRSEGAFLGVFCAALLIAAVFAVRARRPRLAATRSIDRSMPIAGQPFDVVIRLRNTGLLVTAPLTIDEQLPWAPRASAPVLVPAMAPGRVAEVRCTIVPPVRGEATIGPLVSDWSDPFGLIAARAVIALPETVLVAPASVRLPDAALAPADGGGAARVARRRAEGAEDDHSTREYRIGDALRRVHWRASARQGELMVRQEEQHSHPEALLVLDTRRTGWPDAVSGLGDAVLSPAFEWAVGMVASLGAHLAEQGYRVGIGETSSPQLVAPGTRLSDREATEFLAALARVRMIGEHTVPGVRPASRAMAPAIRRGPVFAVLSTPSDEVLDRLAQERLSYDLAIAFAVDPADATVVERLRSDGWSVVSVTAGSDPAEVWAETIAESADHVDA